MKQDTIDMEKWRSNLNDFIVTKKQKDSFLELIYYIIMYTLFCIFCGTTLDIVIIYFVQ